MPHNMFWVDRLLRLAVGSIMLTMAIVGGKDLILYVLGGLLSSTGLLGYCPVYGLAGMNDAEPRPAKVTARIAPPPGTKVA